MSRRGGYWTATIDEHSASGATPDRALYNLLCGSGGELGLPLNYGKLEPPPLEPTCPTCERPYRTSPRPGRNGTGTNGVH